LETQPKTRTVRILFYAALLVALISGAVTVLLLASGNGDVSMVTLVAMLCALTSALMLDYSNEEPA
jgi:uncharacterized membrane protein YoaK (UPF0700 family)